MVLVIFKIIATIVFLAALECTRFVFGRGFAADRAGSLQRCPDPLAVSRGRISKGVREGTARGEEAREGTAGTASPLRKFMDPPLGNTGPRRHTCVNIFHRLKETKFGSISCGSQRQD